MLPNDRLGALLVIAAALAAMAAAARLLAPRPSDLPPNPFGPEVGYT